MKLLKWLNKYFEESFLIAGLIMMVVTMGTQIVARYIFNSSLSWSEELMRYIFIWSAFISIGFCIKSYSSLKVEILVMMMPRRFYRWLSICIHVAIFIVLLILFKGSLDVVSSAIASGQKTPALQVPILYVQVATPVGFILGEIRLIQRFINLLRNKTHVDPQLELEEESF